MSKMVVLRPTEEELWCRHRRRKRRVIAVTIPAILFLSLLLWVVIWLVVASAISAFNAFGQTYSFADERDRICQPGFSKSIRPSEWATEGIKRSMLRARGIPQSRIRDYELDHICPLELDCPALDMSNLQLQLWPRAREKDRKENEAHRAYCAGEISLEEARGRFTRDPE